MYERRLDTVELKMLDPDRRWQSLALCNLSLLVEGSYYRVKYFIVIGFKDEILTVTTDPHGG
jgi:hypothetical protein